MIQIRNLQMKRILEFPFEVDLYPIATERKRKKNSVKTIVGRGGISLSEHQNSLYFNLGFKSTLSGKGFYYNITVAKYYLYRAITDCLLFRPIKSHHPGKYHYNDVAFRGLMDNSTPPVEDIHTTGAGGVIEDVLNRMAAESPFNLSEKQKVVMGEQRALLLKRSRAIEFMQPALIGDELLKISEDSWR